MRRPEEHQQAVKKPSLLSGSGDAAAANSRILTTLERGGKGVRARKPPVGRRYAGIVGLLSILGVGAAIFVYLNTVPSAQPAPPQAGSLHASLIAKKPESLSVPAPEAEPQGLAALIVNEPVAAASHSPAEGLPRIVAEPAKPALAVNARGTGVLSSDASNKPHPAPSTKSTASTRTPPAPAAQHADRGNRSSPATGTEKRGVMATKGQMADPDVALLEALVVRAGERPVRAPESTSKIAKTTSPPAPVTLAKTGDGNHDFVERKPGNSTESLLLRCGQLGFFEGELCRWRMCSGRWNTDPACKVTQESQ